MRSIKDRVEMFFRRVYAKARTTKKIWSKDWFPNASFMWRVRKTWKGWTMWRY